MSPPTTRADSWGYPPTTAARAHLVPRYGNPARICCVPGCLDQDCPPCRARCPVAKSAGCARVVPRDAVPFQWRNTTMSIVPTSVSPRRSFDARGRVALPRAQERSACGMRRQSGPLTPSTRSATPKSNSRDLRGAGGRHQRGIALRPQTVRRCAWCSSTRASWGWSNLLANPLNARCRQWARDLLSAGVRVVVPEICDYEGRRKLIHIGSTSGLIRLDRLKDWLEYDPYHDGRDAPGGRVLGAVATSRGRQRARMPALDGDVILAAMAPCPWVRRMS